MTLLIAIVIVALAVLAVVVFIAAIVGYAVAPLIWMAAAVAVEWAQERLGR